MNAIAWRARHLGADAMIVLPPYAPPTGTAGIAIGQFASAAPAQGQAVFRANAIVFDRGLRQ